MSSLGGPHGAFPDGLPGEPLTPTKWRVGDAVYIDGSSAIVGDVVAVGEEGVTVVWRSTTTVEPPEDLIREGEAP